MRTLRAALVGAAAAAIAPRYVVFGRLDPLLARRTGGHGARLLTDTEVERALAASARVNARLSRLAPRLWRASCLYRAIAECLVRRAAGGDTVVRLGVRRASDGSVQAHAWAADAAPRVETGAEEYAPLSAGGGSR